MVWFGNQIIVNTEKFLPYIAKYSNNVFQIIKIRGDSGYRCHPTIGSNYPKRAECYGLSNLLLSSISLC